VLRGVIALGGRLPQTHREVAEDYAVTGSPSAILLAPRAEPLVDLDRAANSYLLTCRTTLAQGPRD
jgi:hypothetical protein